MMDRQNIASGAPWEAIVGYSRAVRVGPFVFVAGTTASDETGQVIGLDDVYAQTRYIFNKIEKALHQAEVTLADVVRTRMYMTNIDDWEAVAKVHQEVFGDIRPASTLVEVKRLIGPQFLIEIEVEACRTA